MTARSFVLADPDRCIGCMTCMAACLRAHDDRYDRQQPRLHLVATLRVSAPVGCHHCMDAPCVASCPTGCLYDDGARVGIREEKCIGCQSCVLACPFGAVDIGSKPRTESFGGMELDAGERPVVVKCDLCSGRRGGPACVEACPTEGLRLADEAFIAEEMARKRLLSVQAADLSVRPFSNAYAS